jgi:SAM-dependent methyltransferase
MDRENIEHFIDRWSRSAGAERANYQLFLAELCDVLAVDRPDPTVEDDAHNAYVFERSVRFDNRDGTWSTGRIDLYKRGSLVCETKQGVEREEQELVLSSKQAQARRARKKGHGTRGTAAWDDAMFRAVGQAEQYARALPAEEGRPPFLVVIDVGHTIELYAEFSQTGGAYTPFPDPRSHRIRLADLTDQQVRDRLRQVWTEPLALDPARRSAKVTRDIAGKLAELARSLEAAKKHHPEDVAQFLMRCLFTMFAEDVELLPKGRFRELLIGLADIEQFVPVVEDLWRRMNSGGYWVPWQVKLLRFNGGLFADPSALPLSRDQLDLLIEAAKADWRDVEPAIFGTLLERALDPVERHKLGAHYTPRAYVERLVIPTVVEPLREEWDAVRAAAVTLAKEGDKKAAVDELDKFHERLCEVRVLDPACGTGNFLYVTLEHLKRLEGEIYDTYESIAQRQMLLESGHTVDPHQLLGIEINPRAAAIAELVLWIGYLQWHFRTRGNVSPPEPVIKNFKNIECRDALLEWSSRQPLLDEQGKPVTHWDGRTTKKHLVTGEEVPDETAREISYTYLNPKKAEWPQADFIVGNPPFIGDKKLNSTLGDGYVDAIRGVYELLPDSADYVMYWWNRAADYATQNRIRRFGFITTNSIKQPFNRRIVDWFTSGEPPLSLDFAIPDHPWVDAELGAKVRISMSVASRGTHEGGLVTIVSEREQGDAGAEIEFVAKRGQIQPNFSIGAATTRAEVLAANSAIANVGVALHARGLALDEKAARQLLQDCVTVPNAQRYIRQTLNARDVAQQRRNAYVIDLFGVEQDQLVTLGPIYQWLLDRVLPERQTNARRSYRERWWIAGEPRQEMRAALHSLRRYIATPLTASHRYFLFIDSSILPDQALVTIATDDAYILGALSSRVHVVWTLSTGGTLEDRPRYNKTVCFDPFPFPVCNEALKSRIRNLAEQLDAHRKRQQELHPGLTMTGMYNVLEKLRASETLSAKEQQIHEQGLVSVLKQIHDELDAAVAEAYGWQVDLSDEEILERLVKLNHERAEEERRGLVRWLRPEFQNRDGVTQTTIEADAEEAPVAKPAKVAKLPWPKTLAEQAAAVQAALSAGAAPVDAADLAKHFTRANKERIAELLETLASLGKARELADGRYLA